MNLQHPLSAVAAALSLVSVHASAVTIDFENLAVGSVLSNQYSGIGAVFAGNAFSGAGSSTSGAAWASNTDMTVVSSAGSDVGILGAPSLVSGNVLGSFNGWLGEDGDPSFSILFSTPVTSVSADFAGVSTPADVRLFAYNGANLLGSVAGMTAGQLTLSYSAGSITRVAITPGSFDDWAAVDNIVFAPVPEPASYGMMVLGLGLLGLVRRKRDGGVSRR